MQNNNVILIPSLSPDERLLRLIVSLREEGFRRIIVVDDGSEESYQPLFDLAEQIGCTVIHHDFNQGKGTAIKTGLYAAIVEYGRGISIITADADGQHCAPDIRKIANAMEEHQGALVLGTRDFSGEQVPWKSRLGNRITAAVFRLTTGVSLQDTQTGLRGIPKNLLPLALSVEGSRYEYEMNFLSDAVTEADLVTVPIETIYADSNRGSHFRPVRDSLRVYGRLVRFAIASLAGAATDYSIFLLMLTVLAGLTGTRAEGILWATLTARLVSGSVNFGLNKYWSFRSRGWTGAEVIRYGMLFLALMGFSSLGVILLGTILSVLAAKLITDTLLFFVSYAVQKRWVFREESAPMKGII